MGVDLKRNGKNRSGQATIEMAMALPIIITLIFYTINAYYSVHTAHVGQRYAAMNLYQRLNHRSKFVMDDLPGQEQLHNKTFMAVQYGDQEGNAPTRKILLGPIQINTTVGICREPGC
jgi:hypothetical protein